MWSTKIHQSGYSFALVSNFKLSIISEASSKLGETNVHVPNPAPGRPVLVGKTSQAFNSFTSSPSGHPITLWVQRMDQKREPMSMLGCTGTNMEKSDLHSSEERPPSDL